MRELIELRIPEESARRVLDVRDGEVLGGSVRKIEIPVGDERLERIRQMDEEMRAEGRAFFTYWRLKRHYTPRELAAAELLTLEIVRELDQAGAEFGTPYDESTACEQCGAGAEQVGRLRLDQSRLPRRTDIAVTLAGELVVTARLAQVLAASDLSGFALHRLVAKSGSVEDAGGSRSAEEPGAGWQQLVLTGPPAPLSPETTFGVDIFNRDVEGRYRYPCGHVAGLNRLSEVHLERSGWPDTDFAATRELVGERRGLFRPMPMLIVSQRARQVFVENDIKGCRFEVAHLNGA